MLDVMFELPGQDNIRECIINEDVVTKGERPMLVYENEAESAAEKHSEDGVAKNEVGYLVRGKIGITAFSEMSINPIGTAEREDVSQTVPPWPDIVPQAEDKRIKVDQVVGKHWCADCH